MSTIRLSLLSRAGAVGAVVLAGAGLVAFATPSFGGQDAARTVHLRTTLVSITVNDAGAGGPGDVLAVRFTLRTAAGQRGHAVISCQRMTTTENLCHASFVLPEGQIDAQAAIDTTATEFTAAVTGGTGAFEGATGHVHNVDVTPAVTDRTFYLRGIRG